MAADELENLTLKQLALLREDMQAGFAKIHAELASLNESARALARADVAIQRDLRAVKDRVTILTVAFGDEPPLHT
jgi:hypothetical protein